MRYHKPTRPGRRLREIAAAPRPNLIGAIVLVALSATLAGCASAGGGSGLGPPVLSGDYELSGDLGRGGAEPGFNYILSFLPNDMFSYVTQSQVGRPDPPQRYQISGDYVRITVEGHEVRIRRGPAGGLAADVAGTYVTSERTEEYCVEYAVDESGRRYCVGYDERVIRTQSTYRRETWIRRLEPIGDLRHF